MNESDEILRYGCPSCQAQLKTKRKFAGRRVKCPHCESPVQVPSPNAEKPDKSQRETTATTFANGNVSISLQCPQCSSTLSATSDQIGQEIVCDECLEGVTVTAPKTSQTTAPQITAPKIPTPQSPPLPPVLKNEPPPVAAPPSPLTPVPPPTPVDDDDDDMFRLAPLDDGMPTPTSAPLPSILTTGRAEDDEEEVIELGEDLLLTPLSDDPPTRPQMMDTIKAAEARSDEQFGNPGSKPATSPLEPIEPPAEELVFGFSCTVCSTRLHAAVSQVNDTMTCPDCFTENKIPKPVEQPRPSHVNVDDAEEFGLGAGVADPSFPDAGDVSPYATNPKATADKWMREAEEELESEYDTKAELDAEPPAVLMVSFLVDPGAILCIVVPGLIFGALLSCFGMMGSEDGTTRLMGMLATLCMSIFSLLAMSYLLGSCIAVVSDTAAGMRKVENWPSTGSIGDWFGNIFAIFNPLWFSGIPGCLLAILVSLATGTGYGFCVCLHLLVCVLSDRDARHERDAVVVQPLLANYVQIVQPTQNAVGDVLWCECIPLATANDDLLRHDPD